MKKMSSVTSYLFMIMLISLSISGCREENSAPVISAVSITPEIIEIGETATVVVDVADLENDEMTFTYEVTGGYISGRGLSVAWTAPQTTGAYSLTVTVTDTYGGFDVGNGSLTVVYPPTQIVGTASFKEGLTGDLANAVARIYSSWENWRDIKPVMKTQVLGDGESVTFTFNDVDPGRYFLDVWSDNDRDSIWSQGDYAGWYGTGGFSSIELTEINIEEGQKITVEVEILVI